MNILKKNLISNLALIFVCSTSFAATIFVSDFSNDSTITHLNHLKDTVINEINGNIEGSGAGSTLNIKADSLGELDFSDNINPRIRANEILGIGVDTTTTQTAYVDTGLTPADTANLTSNISAGTAYINGFRVAKAATANTYTASKDTYVDLDQNGSYTFSEVAVGGAAPAVAANSARLARVTTDGSEITSVTDLANRSVPGLVVPTNYREGGQISLDSTTVIRIRPLVVEMNGAIVTKTDDSTLTLSTAGDWAGGSSLQATSTYGYVGIDTSANLKLHTTAPTHSNFGVTKTGGIKRYATWSSTVYRILGWFFMNSTGSGEIDTYGYGDITDGHGTNNSIFRFDATQNTVNDTSFGSDLTNMAVRYYSKNTGPHIIEFQARLLESGGTESGYIIDIDGTDEANSLREYFTDGTKTASTASITYPVDLQEGTHTITVQASVDSNAVIVLDKSLIVREL